MTGPNKRKAEQEAFMTKMRQAIKDIGEASVGRKWIVIWQSTHPDVPDNKTKFGISYPVNIGKEGAAQLLIMGLEDLGFIIHGNDEKGEEAPPEDGEEGESNEHYS